MVFTFPFKVVEANSLASGVALGVDKMECVVVQASGYEVTAVSMPLSNFDSGRTTHRFLELLEIIMGLRLLCTLHVALHHRKSRQNGRKAFGTCRGHLERVEHSLQVGVLGEGSSRCWM